MAKSLGFKKRLAASIVLLAEQPLFRQPAPTEVLMRLSSIIKLVGLSSLDVETYHRSEILNEISTTLTFHVLGLLARSPDAVKPD